MPSRRHKLAALAGGGIGCVGIAAAAILLTTTITGSATVVNGPPGSGTSNEVSVDVDANAANGSQLDCSGITVSGDSTSLSFNPRLVKPANGANASGMIVGGSCTVTLDVRNTGSKAITVSDAQLNLPAGWVVGETAGLDRRIEPAATQRLTAVVSATESAVAGDVTGRLVYSD